MLVSELEVVYSVT